MRIKLLPGVLLLVLLGAFINLNGQSTRYYVDLNAKGKNDGSSWKNAFTYFGYALDVSTYGDEIWVAKGKYSAKVGFPFTLNKSVRIYGGFNGGETDLSQRDLLNSRAILEQNKPEKFLYHANILQVSNTDTTAVIDGLIFQNGFAYLYEEDDGSTKITCKNNPYGARACHGGAIFMESDTSADPLYLNISNCIFRNNFANYGAAIFYFRNGHEDGGINVSNSEFYENYSIYSGPCIYLIGGEKYTSKISNCSFHDNKSEGGDAAISYSPYLADSAVFYIENSIFERNQTVGDLSTNSPSLKIWASEEDKISINNCTFKENGGSLECFNSKVSNCRFNNNNSGVFGSESTFTNCIFDNNIGTSALSLFGNKNIGPSKVINCTFFNNSTFSKGGAINIDGADVYIYNSIFSKNKSVVLGDNIYLTGFSNAPPFIFNSLFNISSYDSIVIRDSNWNATDNIDTTSILLDDPIFWDTALGDFRLGFCSPAIDKGKLIHVIKYGIKNDFNNEPRVKGFNPDMGAYEMDHVPSKILIKNATSAISQDGEINLEGFKGAREPIQFTWNTGSVDSSINTLNPGSYSVIIEDGTGCIDTFYYKVDILSSTNSIQEISEVNISPNVVKEGSNPMLNLRSTMSQELQVSISNNSGQILRNEKWNTVIGLNALKLKSDTIGLYYVTLKDNAGNRLVLKYIIY